MNQVSTGRFKEMIRTVQFIQTCHSCFLFFLWFTNLWERKWKAGEIHVNSGSFSWCFLLTIIGEGKVLNSHTRRGLYTEANHKSYFTFWQSWILTICLEQLVQIVSREGDFLVLLSPVFRSRNCTSSTGSCKVSRTKAWENFCAKVMSPFN